MNFASTEVQKGWLDHFSKADDKSDQQYQRVIFFISVQNYNGFNGFRLNGEKYSAYPMEREVILLDGTKVIVMKVEEIKMRQQSENKSEENQKITFIHLFAVC